ncbi:MAG: PDZ domain-containing protein [Bacteroidales bacterium]|nr:PDZ domain-containing protein [Bacteroidales bacterium]
MMGKNRNSVVIALLGVAVGVLATLLSGKIYEKKKFDGDYNRWRKLNLILQEVQKNYVDTIDMAAMTDAAVVAALSELDPHSVYLPPVELTESEEELSGNFEGIGITFNVPNDTAVVLNTIQGGPSEKAGLTQGDRIVRVNDKNVAGVRIPQDSLIKLMRGPSGTKVRITVERGGEMIPFDIVRDRIPVHCVDASFMIDGSTGYIKLSKFTRTTFKEFRAATSSLIEQGMTKLVFDLRDNTGGYFDQALLLSNEFLEDGDDVVYMEGLHRPRQDYRADGRGRLKDIELVVLINEGTASSSEIFAGAIQDNDRGVIVGRRSFGKGLVQEPVNFTDGSGIRLTVARFHTPSGRCIQKPYDKNYQYDIYERYAHGEMTSADSMKVDTTAVYYTVRGRRVYGGGGIIPDRFVPMDTTRATDFYISCNKKATSVRFASWMFDRYRSQLSEIDDFDRLESYLESVSLDRQFLDYAARVDGIRPKAGEWEESKEYMMPQIKALVGRYSKLGDEAFYRFYIPVDDTIQTALKQ